VTVDELAARLGFSEFDDVAKAAAANSDISDLEAHVATDWAGSPAVPVEVASEVLVGVLTAREEHDQRWTAYQQYLADRERAAREERERAAREVAEAARKRAERDGDRFAEQRQRESEAELQRRRAEALNRAGDPVPFAKFEQ